MLTFLSFRTDHERALGFAIGAATDAIAVALLPLVLAQTIVALFLGCVGTRFTAISVVAMSIGLMLAAAVQVGAFWLILHTPFLAFIALAPFISISPLLGFILFQHWLIAALTAQVLMLTFSWWRLRRSPPLAGAKLDRGQISA